MDNQEVKEEYCGACIAGVAALAGVGTATVNNSTTKNRQTKKIIFYTSITVSIISIIILIYLIMKKCKECE